MGKAIRASVVVLLLACPAYAGDIQNGVTGTPPPPTGDATQQQAGGMIPGDAQGDMQNDVTDSLAETVLTVLTGVLAIL
jgi:hypothetical protein